jgi:hypothetical protein
VSDFSFIEAREGLHKVAVGKISHCYINLVDWVRIFPTYSLRDKILAPFLGRILNSLMSPNDTFEKYPKSFPYLAWKLH